MIKLTNVEKSYDSRAGSTWVLRRINLEIREGEFVTIMGPSGAGKSTLMGIIGMLDGDWRGEYFLAGHAVHKLNNRGRVELHKQYVGFVFTGSLHSSQGKMIMDMLKKLNEEGTTIIQVTHNDSWAAYGNRVIQLADGWIVNGQIDGQVDGQVRAGTA